MIQVMELHFNSHFSYNKNFLFYMFNNRNILVLSYILIKINSLKKRNHYFSKKNIITIYYYLQNNM